ncbi:MAG TPA: hypothetical protein ENI85_02645 [Deltaproteobacteria bacterium]|nr:hypothetical protein [Deltaproteobacteria bacterium]
MKSRNRIVSTIVVAGILAGLFGASPPAQGDTSETQEEILEQDRTLRGLWLGFQDRVAGIRLRAMEEVETGARYDDTNLDWVWTGLSIQGALPLPDPRRGLAVSFSTRVLTPIVRGSTRFVDLPGSPDDPFDPMLDSALRVGGHIGFGRGFGLALGAGLAARHEIGADLKSALAVGGSIALEYRREDWLRVRLGVGMGTGIDRARLAASPVFRMRIRPRPDLWLEVGASGGRIEWAISPRLELSLFGGIDSRRYRLDERGGRLGAGSIEIEKSEVGMGIRARVGRTLRVRGETAVVLGRRISILDEDRRSVDARDTREPSVALRIFIEWRPFRGFGGSQGT